MVHRERELPSVHSGLASLRYRRGVVDQHVQPVVPLLTRAASAGSSAATRGPPGSTRPGRFRGAADLVDGPFGPGAVAADQPHPGAGPGQRDARGQTDAAVGAGHQADPSGQVGGMGMSMTTVVPHAGSDPAPKLSDRTGRSRPTGRQGAAATTSGSRPPARHSASKASARPTRAAPRSVGDARSSDSGRAEPVRVRSPSATASRRIALGASPRARPGRRTPPGTRPRRSGR